MRASISVNGIATAIVAAAFVASTASAAAPPLATIDVAPRRHVQIVVVEASVEAVHQATVGAQVSGRIVDLPVKAGDAVRAGQVLARIDARAADAAVAAGRSQIAEAEANLANARRVHERNVELAARQFVSQAAVDQSQAAYKAALAQVESVRANAGAAVVQRDWTTIVAPYAGVVGETLAELGDMAVPGKGIVTLFEPRDLRVVATVPQTTLARAGLEQAQIELGEGAERVRPLRATVIPIADARSHTTRVRFDLPPRPGVLPGQYARVRLPVGQVDAIAVPETALIRRGEVTAVYVVDANGRPRMRQVRTGERLDGGAIEILAGLSGGESIAADPVAAGMRTAAK